MQKKLKKVHFLKKFWLENVERVTKPLKFFVQKISCDMCVNTPEFKENCSIRFKNSFLTFEGHFLIYPELPSNAWGTERTLGHNLSEKVHHSS